MITFPMSATSLSAPAPVTTRPRNQLTPPAEQAWQCSQEISRMLTAALVNRKFCHLLLTDPLLAMRSGYNGETFQLSADELDLLLSIEATSLHDFAAQLQQAGSGRPRQSTTERGLEESEAFSTRPGWSSDKFIQPV